MSWNEPGKGPGNDKQGPPDLDEALKKLQQQFAAFLGGKGNKKGGDAQRKSSSGAGWFGFITVLLIALLVWALAGIYIVRPAEQAVVLRFGKYVKTVGPGIHWVPRLIESKEIVNVEKISTYSYSAQMLNKDENIVLVSVAVQYRIGNPKDYLYNVVNPTESLQQATASSLRQVVGHTTLDEVLTTGREQVRRDISVLLKQVLGRYQTGIEITDVALLPARAPEEVKDAFDDAIKAQEDEVRFINQAQAYVASVVPIAEGRAARIIEEAEAYRQRVVLASQGASSRFLALLTEYEKAPRVTRERLYIDALEQVLGQSSKVIVDVEGGNNLFYLPLDQLRRAAGEGDTQADISVSDELIELQKQAEQTRQGPQTQPTSQQQRSNRQGRTGNYVYGPREGGYR